MSGISPGGLFLSYRRADSGVGAYVLLLQRQLKDRFPKVSVFVDLEAIRLGANFVDVMKNAVESSAVLIVLIGRDWLDDLRIFDAEDYVRLEIRAAFERKVPVVPVLVNGADPPRQQQLPLEIQELARLNALHLTYQRYQYDAGRLMDHVDEALKASRSADGDMTGDGVQQRTGGVTPTGVEKRASNDKISARDARERLQRLAVPVTEAAFRNAVSRGDHLLAGLLVDAGISVETPSPVPDSYLTARKEAPALLRATMVGHLELAIALIQRGAQPNVSDETGTTPLIIAAHRGYGLVVEALLFAHAHIEATDTYGSSALMKAAEMGHSDIVSLLINAGADLDKRDSVGRTALFRVADTYRQTSHFGSGAHDALLESGRRLLTAGADLSLTSKDGVTAPQIVAHGGGNLIDIFFGGETGHSQQG